MRYRILPYKAASKSAKVLSQATGIRRLRVKRITPFAARAGDVFINWGAGSATARSVLGEGYDSLNWVNHPDLVSASSDKLVALTKMRGAGTVVPDFTTSFGEACAWADDGSTVVCRETVRGHSGHGITIAEGYDDMVEGCALYTKYVPKFDEYRVHVIRGEVVDVQQKRKRTDVEEANYRVRNSANGWVFCRENIELHNNVPLQSIAAVAALGLDFGAVDVGFTRRGDVATVYEVNTACGLEGQTIETYKENIL